MRYLATLLFVCATAFAQPKVHLLSNLPSPQPVGTVIGLMARLDMPPGPPGGGPPMGPPNGGPPPGAPQGPPPGAPPGGGEPPRPQFGFRYSVSEDGGPFRVVRDFSPNSQYQWRPALYEHDSVVRLTMRMGPAGPTMDSDLPFHTETRAKGSGAVVTPTAHPLVALLSAPACENNAQFRGAFQREGDTAVTTTAWMPCNAARSNNVYIAGMRADSQYGIRAELKRGDAVEKGADVPFHTGFLDGKFPPIHVVQAPEPTSSPEGMVLYGFIDERITAADLGGNVTWYLPRLLFLTRMLPGGTILAIGDGDSGTPNIERWQLLQEFDLAGNVVRETNIRRVAEQLKSRGIDSDCRKGGQQCVSGFHHDAIRLPNGHTLAITSLERMFPAGTQESKGPVDVMGDLVVDLDENFQVAGVWNAFDHMDIKRMSVSKDHCPGGAGNDGCAPVLLADAANGWLHANSLNYVAGEGNFLFSMPEQDWVIKVDYRDGKGSGKILWRLGVDGDLKAKSDDPMPWFSYQHDVGFDPPGSNMLLLLDDAQRRKQKNPSANNRGQVWKIDEASKTATLVVNADLKVFSPAVGSAQLLSNGNYSFDTGLMNPGPAMASRSIEVSKDGKLQYSAEVPGIITYRSYRIKDLYSAPER